MIVCMCDLVADSVSKLPIFPMFDVSSLPNPWYDGRDHVTIAYAVCKDSIEGGSLKS